MFCVLIREPVMVVLVKAMKNPRSALCKTSIMAAADVFVAYSDKMLEDTLTAAFESLVISCILVVFACSGF